MFGSGYETAEELCSSSLLVLVLVLEKLFEEVILILYFDVCVIFSYNMRMLLTRTYP